MRLSDQERDAVRTFTAQLRVLLTSEHPSSDPAVARLFPPALPDDDVLGNLEYEQQHGDELLLGKLEALDTVDRTLDERELTEDELLAWLGSLNSIRLVVGTRLGVTEESTEKDFAGRRARDVRAVRLPHVARGLGDRRPSTRSFPPVTTAGP